MNTATVRAVIVVSCSLIAVTDADAHILIPQCASAVITNFSASPNPINPQGLFPPKDNSVSGRALGRAAIKLHICFSGSQ